MPDPIGSFAQRLVDLLQPMFYNDDGSLTIYLGSMGDVLFQTVDDWASDTDDGKPGYSLLVDPTRCPVDAIPWLAQFVGATITTGLSEADQRTQLVGLGNWKRGTADSIKLALQPLLTGGQTVQIKERDTSPYHFQVLTLASETPNQTAVIATINATKPAGLQYTYVYFSGQKAFTIGSSALRGSPPDALRLVI